MKVITHTAAKEGVRAIVNDASPTRSISLIARSSFDISEGDGYPDFHFSGFRDEPRWVVPAFLVSPWF